MSVNKEVPNGWAWATIPEMIPSEGVFVDGDWIESKDQDPNGEVRLIQLADIGDGNFKNKSSRFLTLKRANALNCTFLRQNDILVARMPDPIGRACLFPLKNENSFVTAVDVAIIRLGEKSVIPKYLMYSINNLYIRREIESLQSGTTRKRISRSNLAIIKFPLPPLPEQHRIVANIEELFSSLDKGIESLRTAQQQLKIYRQAVLKWAFEGKLTNKNVAEGKLLEGWKWVKYGSIGKLVSGQHILEKDYNYLNEGMPYFTGPADFGKKYPIVTKWTAKLKAIANDKDILITVKGAGVGKINIMNIKLAAISRQLMALSSKELVHKYLYYFLDSKFYEFQKLGLGSTVPGLDRDTILNFQIPLAPLPEQNAIVAEIESRLSVCDRIEESVEESLKQSEALRQSILKKAFEGKLVPQDPNDEPASVLLERIKAEREKNKSESLLHRQAGKTKKVKS